MADKPAPVDIVILTVLPEEFEAMLRCLQRARSAPSVPARLNRYAWEVGEIPRNGTDQVYTVALGMVGQAGTVSSAIATQAACDLWQPNYLFFVGIAGGFPVDEITNGDVVISDRIYGYEYGKIDQEFSPRDRLTYPANRALLNQIQSFISRNKESWLENSSFKDDTYKPKVIVGNIASGDKVIDNPDHDFFVHVSRKFYPLHAVEMEGAGAAAAIEQINDHTNVRFLMIRGISDMPRSAKEGEMRGTGERDMWKKRAAAASAAFTVAFVAGGLPDLPRQPYQDIENISLSENPQNSINVSGDKSFVGNHNNVSYHDNSHQGLGVVAVGGLVVVILCVSLALYWIANRATSSRATTSAPPLPPTATPDVSLQRALGWKVALSDNFTGVSSSLPVTRTVDQYAEIQTSIVNDSYQIRMKSFREAIGWPLPHPSTIFTDFLVCVDIMRIAGPSDSAAALIFRAKEIENEPNNAFFYGIRLIPGEQSYRIKGNPLRGDADFERTDPVSAHVINPNGVNRLCVLAEGSRFSYYINGAYVHNNSGYDYQSGKFNLGVSIPRKGETIYQFDNLEIRTP